MFAIYSSTKKKCDLKICFAAKYSIGKHKVIPEENSWSTMQRNPLSQRYSRHNNHYHLATNETESDGECDIGIGTTFPSFLNSFRTKVILTFEPLYMFFLWFWWLLTGLLNVFLLRSIQNMRNKASKNKGNKSDSIISGKISWS